MTCLCICGVRVCACVCVYLCVCLRESVSLCVYISACVHVCMCVCVRECVCVCVYLKSEPVRFPFSGSPGSGQELDACLIPPSFTTARHYGKQEDSQSKAPWEIGRVRARHHGKPEDTESKASWVTGRVRARHHGKQEVSEQGIMGNRKSPNRLGAVEGGGGICWVGGACPSNLLTGSEAERDLDSSCE